ncbi:MAG: Y-family DNA polymerase, partial [Alphaproteobacteria bacterium]
MGGGFVASPIPRRIIAVALPHLAAEARLRHEGQAGFPRPFAIVAPEGGALRLVSLNPAAAALGLAPGLGLADARAICPALLTRPGEPARLAAFRHALARWAERFSPIVSIGASAGDDTLTLDATGGAHLFGGEAAMLAAIAAALAVHCLTARPAIADTRGAAWALAHFGGPDGPPPPAQPPRPTTGLAPAPSAAGRGGGAGGGACNIAPRGQTRAAIAALPVAALRLDPEAARGLTALGLATIGDAARIPRGALARRFGLATLKRLDQALGAEPEPVAPDRPPATFAARLTLPEPIGHVADVMAGLEHLLARLCQALEAHQMGARALRLTVRRVDGADTGAGIALARPGRDPARISALFAPGVAGIEAGFGIDALRLEATAVEPMRPAQLDHARDRAAGSENLADLLSRIGNRIGFENVIRILP